MDGRYFYFKNLIFWLLTESSLLCHCQLCHHCCSSSAPVIWTWRGVLCPAQKHHHNALCTKKHGIREQWGLGSALNSAFIDLAPGESDPTSGLQLPHLCKLGWLEKDIFLSFFQLSCSVTLTKKREHSSRFTWSPQLSLSRAFSSGNTKQDFLQASVFHGFWSQYIGTSCNIHVEHREWCSLSMLFYCDILWFVSHVLLTGTLKNHKLNGWVLYNSEWLSPQGQLGT